MKIRMYTNIDTFNWQVDNIMGIDLYRLKKQLAGQADVKMTTEKTSGTALYNPVVTDISKVKRLV